MPLTLNGDLEVLHYLYPSMYLSRLIRLVKGDEC